MFSYRKGYFNSPIVRRKNSREPTARCHTANDALPIHPSMLFRGCGRKYNTYSHRTQCTQRNTNILLIRFNYDYYHYQTAWNATIRQAPNNKLKHFRNIYLKHGRRYSELTVVGWTRCLAITTFHLPLLMLILQYLDSAQGGLLSIFSLLIRTCFCVCRNAVNAPCNFHAYVVEQMVSQ